MPINPNIILGYKPPQFRDPLDQAGQLMQLQVLMQKGKALEQEMARERSKELALAHAVSGGDISPESFYSRGLFKEGLEVEKVKGERQKRELETEKLKFDRDKMLTERYLTMLSGVRDQATHDVFRERVARELNPNLLAQVPAQYDPQFIESELTDALSAKDRLERMFPKENDKPLSELAKLEADFKAGRIKEGDYLAKKSKLTTHAPGVSVYSTTLTPGVEIATGREVFLQPSKGGGAPSVVPGFVPKEAAERERTASTKATDALRKAESVTAQIDRALNQVGAFTAGPIGQVTGRFPGTESYNLGKTIDTIKANIGFQELQAMRDASPTGGALGQVAIQELDMLQATLGSLDKGQSPKQLKANLNAAKLHFQTWKKVMQQAAISSRGGAIRPPAVPGEPQATKPGAGRKVERRKWGE